MCFVTFRTSNHRVTQSDKIIAIIPFVSPSYFSLQNMTIMRQCFPNFNLDLTFFLYSSSLKSLSFACCMRVDVESEMTATANRLFQVQPIYPTPVKDLPV